MKNKLPDYLVVAAGLLLLGAGLAMLKLIEDPQGFLLVLPYVCIGIGCGAFGHGMGNLISRRVVGKNPEIQKQIEIEKNDERNVAITNQAKAKAFDMMIFVFGALMVSFALMGVKLIAVLLLVFAYLFIIGCSIYYRCKFDKEI